MNRQTQYRIKKLSALPIRSIFVTSRMDVGWREILAAYRGPLSRQSAVASDSHHLYESSNRDQSLHNVEADVFLEREIL